MDHMWHGDDHDPDRFWHGCFFMLIILILVVAVVVALITAATA